MTNFVFISPHFPTNYWQFCRALKDTGVNVLGIADMPYDQLPAHVQGALTDYYHVPSLEDGDAVLKAVGWFTHRWGKIDWLESNNEFWLEQDAALRTDFNITTGAQNDFIDRIKYKSKMKESYIAAGVPVARHHMVHENGLDDARAFVAQVGYPVIVKPASLGSSIGVAKAENRQELTQALEVAFEFDRKVLIEKAIRTPLELNCSVIGYNGEAKASPVEMPITNGDLLDFMGKYGSNPAKGMAALKRVLPAPIEPELRDEIQGLSIRVFNAMDCKGVVRIDYMYAPEENGLYITEINTIPGSLSFYLWDAGGLPYPRLIDEMVRCALEAKEDKDNCNYAYTSKILDGLSLGGKTGAKSGMKNP